MLKKRPLRFKVLPITGLVGTGNNNNIVSTLSIHINKRRSCRLSSVLLDLCDIHANFIHIIKHSLSKCITAYSSQERDSFPQTAAGKCLVCPFFRRETA